MNILVVNDDGIKAAGIEALVKALSERADVYVCAPDGNRSAKSHSITIGKGVSVKEVDFPYAKKAYASSGTPADCTKIGLQFLEDEGIKPDMVFTGINMGCNLGSDTLYSGTVGAAAEASMSGYHAVAVSVNSREATHFDAACHYALELIDRIYGKLSTDTVINLNTPDAPLSEVKGIKTLALGGRYYEDRYYLQEDGTYELSGHPFDHGEREETDMDALNDGYATITPLQFDFTDDSKMDILKGWRF